MPKYEGQTIPTVGQALPRTGFGSRSTPKSEALPPQRLCLLPYHIRTELGFMKTKGFTGALAFSQHSKNALRGLTHLQGKKKMFTSVVRVTLIEISFLQGITDSQCY